jgi:hypothetical protein
VTHIEKLRALLTFRLAPSILGVNLVGEPSSVTRESMYVGNDSKDWATNRQGAGGYCVSQAAAYKTTKDTGMGACEPKRASYLGIPVLMSYHDQVKDITERNKTHIKDVIEEGLAYVCQFHRPIALGCWSNNPHP